MNITIRKAKEDEMDIVRSLFTEYEQFLGFSLCFQGFQEELNQLPYKYAEPEGTILLAETENSVVGCVALKPLENGICEMKRLYIKEELRGHKLGEKLVNEIIASAKEKGYAIMKLDTLKRLKAACNLYKKFGFVETIPYNFNPEEDIIYFEKAV